MKTGTWQKLILQWAGYRFDPGWDQRLIDMHEKLKECSPKPVISTYPPAITEMAGTPQQKADNPFIRICNGTFSGGPDKTMFRLTSHRYRSHGFAVRTPFAAGGFMFGAGKILSAQTRTLHPSPHVEPMWCTPSQTLTVGIGGCSGLNLHKHHTTQLHPSHDST